ncbi:hypothetical protein [Sulfurimonas sp. HSL-1716]|uniref:hypothetical protein n=1 Tax=Hydrocurvibacter sulfurireducens TaxID=3131937 RepID=UPI0031F7601C
MCNCLDNIVIEGTFPPFIFCPYCGEKLVDEGTIAQRDELLVQADEEAFARLSELEDIIETKFDDILIEDAQTLSERLAKTMDEFELQFPMSVQEERIEIRHEGNYETQSIELFLEQEDDDSPLYTVSVF